MRVTLVYNPAAAGRALDVRELSELLEASGHEVSAGSVKEEGWEELLAEPGELVVVAGGDGTVRKVFKELATPDVDVTIFPVRRSRPRGPSAGSRSRSGRSRST